MNIKEIKTAKSGEDFQKNASQYVANMCENKKMLHIKNCCKDSKFMYEYINFKSLDEAKEFTPRLSMCQKCFPDQ